MSMAKPRQPPEKPYEVPLLLCGSHTTGHSPSGPDRPLPNAPWNSAPGGGSSPGAAEK